MGWLGGMLHHGWLLAHRLSVLICRLDVPLFSAICPLRFWLPKSFRLNVLQPILTPVGKKMVHLPVDPRMSCVILQAAKLGCLSDCLKVVSLLCQDNIFRFDLSLTDRERASDIHRKFQAPQGDLHTLLNIYNAFLAVKGFTERRKWLRENCINPRSMTVAKRTLRQLREICDGIGLQSESETAAKEAPRVDGRIDPALLARAFCHGYFMLSAVLQPKSLGGGEGAAAVYLCRSPGEGNRKKVLIHPASVLFTSPPPALLFVECVKTRKTYMRQVCSIPVDLPLEVAPTYFNESHSG